MRRQRLYAEDDDAIAEGFEAPAPREFTPAPPRPRPNGGRGFTLDEVATSDGNLVEVADSSSSSSSSGDNGPGSADEGGEGREKSERPSGPKEELHGEYERDESTASPLAKKSFLASVTMAMHQNFLSQAPLTRGDALRNMNSTERMIFDFLIVLTPLLLLAKIWQFPQKSTAWKWARTGRITGSTTGVAAGQQRGTPILKGPYESFYLPFKGNKGTMWGSGKEVYGTQVYVNDLKRLVTEVFREQRRSGAIQQTMADGSPGHFVFRNQKIPVLDINSDPDVEVRHYGLLIDPWNHHRGVSPDGVIFINGVPAGVLEVKCAYAKLKSLYVNVKTYYYNQLMSEMYLCHLYWPEIAWLDFVVWSPDHFTVDTYTFDANYYYTWYGPRELKYYFRLYLKALAEKMYHTAQQETEDPNPSNELIQQVIAREFTLPEFEAGGSTPPPGTPGPDGGYVNANPGDAAVDPQSGQGASEAVEFTEQRALDPDWQKALLEMDLDFGPSDTTQPS